MSKEIINTENRQVGPIAKKLLEDLRKTWGKREVERTVTSLNEEGKPAFVQKVMVVDSPNKRLNQGVAAERFYHFAAMVKPEDQERIQSIIRAGCFEVGKAIQAFEIAPKVASDRKIKPTTWEEASDLNSPSLATLVKYKGEDKSVELVYMMLFGFAKKFGRRNDLVVNEGQNDIRELAEDIVSQYRRLSIGDLKMILNQTLKVSAKKFNLDYQGIMQVFEDMATEKMDHGAKKAMDEHAAMTGVEKAHRDRQDYHGMDAEGIGLVVQSMATSKSDGK